MPELVVLRVVNGMSADRAVEVGADALSYPTTTPTYPHVGGRSTAQFSPGQCARPMMIALDGIVSRDCTTPVVAAVEDQP